MVAADCLHVSQKGSVAGFLPAFEVTFRWRVADGALFITAAIGEANLAAI